MIFDEVMTGFRLAKGGAQEVFGVDADIVTFGKGYREEGFPVGAFAARNEIMQFFGSRRTCLSSRNFKRKSTCYECWFGNAYRVEQSL
ncbi:hypothetical protein CCAN12_800019 [Capnocytophaga canimorsus]|uniref:Glutamate-1-semialdehyde 2,1-aminomutase n=1 Tax=Capnocytophaga canimorsus TaxID=28188 RepID=A0A0B7HU00_9FLAO|nr:hypothetical protein CCAN12_800019 [Capnocytophaga canimorsus]